MYRTLLGHCCTLKKVFYHRNPTFGPKMFRKGYDKGHFFQCPMPPFKGGPWKSLLTQTNFVPRLSLSLSLELKSGVILGEPLAKREATFGLKWHIFGAEKMEKSAKMTLFGRHFFGRNPIRSSAWTFRRARTGSYASLTLSGLPLIRALVKVFPRLSSGHLANWFLEGIGHCWVTAVL